MVSLEKTEKHRLQPACRRCGLDPEGFQTLYLGGRSHVLPEQPRNRACNTQFVFRQPQVGGLMKRLVLARNTYLPGDSLNLGSNLTGHTGLACELRLRTGGSEVSSVWVASESGATAALHTHRGTLTQTQRALPRAVLTRHPVEPLTHQQSNCSVCVTSANVWPSGMTEPGQVTRDRVGVVL